MTKKELLKNMARIGAVAVIALFAATSTSCKKDNDDDIKGNVMTITRSGAGNAFVQMSGDGTMSIDWGDGTAVQTHKLQSFDALAKYEHTYSDATVRTITITGNVTWLNSPGKSIMSVDVSKNTVLEMFMCSNTQITNLDLSKNTALKVLSCDENQLTKLDVSKNTALYLLNCSGNQLTELDVSKNTAMKQLICHNNQLINLDVSKNIELWELSLHGNQFSAASLDTVFETLHSSTLYNPNRTEIGKVIYIRNNPGALTCDRSIATSKGWLVDTTFQR